MGEGKHLFWTYYSKGENPSKSAGFRLVSSPSPHWTTNLHAMVQSNSVQASSPLVHQSMAAKPSDVVVEAVSQALHPQCQSYAEECLYNPSPIPRVRMQTYAPEEETSTSLVSLQEHHLLYLSTLVQLQLQHQVHPSGEQYSNPISGRLQLTHLSRLPPLNHILLLSSIELFGLS